jgi:hypothetical protein
MRHKRLTRFALAAALLVLSAPVFAQNFPLDVELGYRFVNVAGNDNMYRSQINEAEGFLLRSLTFASSDFEGKLGFADKIRLDISDVGVGPASSIRFEIGKSRVYKFTFVYDRWRYFSALPAFANPFLANGIVPGQQTYQRLRNVYDAELAILPGTIFSPIFGYTYNKYTGPSTSTVHVGQDEFRLNQSFYSWDEQPRVGFNFATGPVNVNFMQGWRRYHEETTSVLTPGAGAGNGTTPILGQQQTLISYSRNQTTDVNIPITTASGVWQLGCFGKILGTYVRTTGSSDTQGPTNLDGTLVNFEIARFFGGLNETVSSSVNNLTWRGAARAEFTVTDGVEVAGGWKKAFREISGQELMNQIFYNTALYNGAAAPNVQQILNINNGLSRSDESMDLGIIARHVGPFGLRFTYTHTKQATSVNEDIAEYVVGTPQQPYGQAGYYDRAISTYDAGMTFGVGFLTLGADYRADNANQAILRTDSTMRQSWRTRAGFKVGKLIEVNSTFSWAWESNTTVGIESKGSFRQVGGDFNLMPTDWLTLRFSGYNFSSGTHIPIINPINFAVSDNANFEDGRAIEGGLVLNLKAVKLNVSGGTYVNKGTFGFEIDRVRGQLEVPIFKKFSVIGEAAYDKYTETVYTYGDYSATRIGLYAHWAAF